jgi:hypothetical protein
MGDWAGVTDWDGALRVEQLIDTSAQPRVHVTPEHRRPTDQSLMVIGSSLKHSCVHDGGVALARYGLAPE